MAYSLKIYKLPKTTKMIRDDENSRENRTGRS
jgi:hypothetical protein